MNQSVRISGLVRIANVVRRELSGTMSMEQRDRLRGQTQRNLATVEQILRDRGATVQNLPPPSQRAYRFLSGINWTQTGAAVQDDSAVRGEPVAAAPSHRPSMISWRRSSSLMELALDELARDPAVPQVNLIEAMSRQMELTIQRQNITPDRMSPATREQRGWFGFMSRPENLSAYIQSRQTASRVLNAAALGSRQYPPPLTIHFRPIRGMYKLKAGRQGVRLWLPTPMIAFDEAAFLLVGALIYRRDGVARQRVIELMTSEGYQTVRAELESLGGISEQTRGATHDLGQSFDRVNAGYFGGKMARPRLTWNRTFTGRKFGHYDFILDTVMVSRTLDSHEVPEYVVDFLVFHELLHKFHGLHWVNGRGYAHTAEFYESERKFARYQKAEAFLGKLAREVR
ncbi:MAG TPA: hypothetical protein VFE47_07110 [Tepidisphaeraceae bacterium]|jgi:hypothetical protein|nr:hypothetical protein [Tepidisphaeraceae bacterium]